jgi:hypothetical protein
MPQQKIQLQYLDFLLAIFLAAVTGALDQTEGVVLDLPAPTITSAGRTKTIARLC